MVSFPAGNHKRMGNYGSRQFSGTNGVGLQPRFLGGSPRFKVQTPSVNPARRIGPIWPLTICWSPEKPQFRKEVPSEKGHVSWPLPDSGSVHLRLMNRGGARPLLSCSTSTCQVHIQPSIWAPKLLEVVGMEG